MCKVLRLHPSGYYAWKAAPLSARAQDDQRLLGLLKRMRAANPCWPQAAVMAGAQMVAGCQRWGSNSSTRLALCVGSLVSTSLR